jgi:hypothetical protein
MKRAVVGVLCSVVVVAGLVGAVAPPAGAATAIVGNGLTTTDLNAPGTSAASLAASLVGSGVTVSNATFTGNNVQAGTIHVVDPAVVSFNDGLIMSSGNIADVVGPNKSESTTTDVNGPGDPTLDALIQNTQTVVPATYDAASLEFDFVPTTNHVYFTYVFGSDEYLEWVNLYNDVFGFFVNGQNCATTPSGQPVSIDTINSTVNPNLYRDNSFANPPANPINIEPDGLSVEMICSAPVNAGQVNHMKLAIADTSDHILDSVVMLKAQSLSVVPPESCNNGVDDNGDGKVDMSDPLCQATTTPPPVGNGGIGSGNTAPPFTGNEGAPIPLDASALGWTATPDTVSTTWQVTGINGTPGSCDVAPATAQPLNPDGSIAVVHAVCPNEGEYVAHVWGWDGPGGTGGSTFDYDVDFFVHNAPPAVTIGAPASGAQVDVGQPVALSASVTDPGASDTATCSIDWGDGTTDTVPVSSGTCDGSHAYANAGPAIIAVTATDNAGASGAAATLVTASSTVGVAPTVTTEPTDAVVGTGQPYAYSAAADGTPAPTVQWQRSSDAGATWTDVPGATATTLTGTATLGDSGARFRAVFTNDSGSANSAPASLTVTGTEVALAASTTTPVVGQPVTLTATVHDAVKAAGSIGGTMRFYDGATLLGSKAFTTGGVASIVTRKLGVGAHSVTAVYRATTKSPMVVSPVLGVVVSRAATTVALAAKPLKGTTTTLFTFTATVKVVVPGTAKAYPGTVVFTDGATLLGSVDLVTGAVAKLTTTLPTGIHAVRAVYLGNTNLLPSAGSNVRTVTVT